MQEKLFPTELLQHKNEEPNRYDDNTRMKKPTDILPETASCVSGSPGTKSVPFSSYCSYPKPVVLLVVLQHQKEKGKQHLKKTISLIRLNAQDGP